MPYLGVRPADITSAAEAEVAGDLTVDTNTLHVDAANNRVGIGTSSPSRLATVSYASGQADFSIQAASNNYAQALFGYSGADNKGIIAYYNADNSMQFYTNSTERMRLLAGGGLTFNGDTAAANALDDYEQGAITGLAVNQGTITTSTGLYRKVGAVVHFSVLVSTFSNRTSNATIAITGLPFTSNANNQTACAVLGRHYSSSASALTGFVFGSSSQIYLYKMDGGNYSSLQHSDLNNSNAEFYISGSYHV